MEKLVIIAKKSSAHIIDFDTFLTLGITCSVIVICQYLENISVTVFIFCYKHNNCLNSRSGRYHQTDIFKLAIKVNSRKNEILYKSKCLLHCSNIL